MNDKFMDGLTKEQHNKLTKRLAKPKIHENHRSRLREKAKRDLRILETYELVELLLYDSIPLKDTNPIAHDLMNRFGSLKNLLNSSWKDLFTVQNMSERASVNLTIIGELARRLRIEAQTPPKTISYLEEFISFLQAYLEESTLEEVLMVCLASDDSVLGTFTLGVGDFDSVSVTPRKIVKEALYTNAVKVLLAHNHPSGKAVASNADHILTNEIIDALRAVRVRLVDHVIIGKNGNYFSFSKDRHFSGNLKTTMPQQAMYLGEPSMYRYNHFLDDNIE